MAGIGNTFQEKFTNSVGKVSGEDGYLDGDELAEDLDILADGQSALFRNDYSITDNYRMIADIKSLVTFPNVNKLAYTLWSTVYTASTPQYASALSDFGYQGRMLQNTLKATVTNHFLWLPLSVLSNSNLYNTNATLKYRFLLKASKSVSIRFRFYAQYEDNSILLASEIYKTNVAADTILEFSDLTSAIDSDNAGSALKGIQLRYYYYDGAVDTMENCVIKISQIYVGDKIPLISENELFSDYRKYLENLDVDAYSYDSYQEKKLGIHWLSDSILNNVETEMALLTDRALFDSSCGGETQAQILSHMDDLTDYYNYTTVFWCSRNGMSGLQAKHVFDNFVKTVNKLPHNRFIVVPPLVGNVVNEYDGGSSRANFDEIARMMRETYPDKYIGIIDAILQRYDYGATELTASFTQPSVGANVQISVNSTAFFTAIGTSTLAIGFKNGDVDKYTIISTDSPTLLTIRLDESNRIATGGTVENYLITDAGYSAYDNLDVIDLEDYDSIVNRITPKTWRVSGDDFHPDTTHGVPMLTKIIYDKIKSMNY